MKNCWSLKKRLTMFDFPFNAFLIEPIAPVWNQTRSKRSFEDARISVFLFVVLHLFWPFFWQTYERSYFISKKNYDILVAVTLPETLKSQLKLLLPASDYFEKRSFVSAFKLTNNRTKMQIFPGKHEISKNGWSGKGEVPLRHNI